jgi:hypothetical protein
VLREIYEHLSQKPGFVAMLRDDAKARDHNVTESNDARPFDQVGPSGVDSRPDPDCLT